MKVRPSVKPICETLQGHPPSRSGAGDLHQSPAQAASGLRRTRSWHVSPVSTSLGRSVSRSPSPTSTGSVAPPPCRSARPRRIDPGTRVRDLTDEEVVRLRNWIDANLKVEGDLRRDVSQDIKRKMEIGSYQGIRHRRGLPVRGQRTHTNARTRKGPKKTVAGKKKVRK